MRQKHIHQILMALKTNRHWCRTTLTVTLIGVALLVNCTTLIITNKITMKKQKESTMKYRSKYNYILKKTDCNKVDPKSQTVQHDAYSVKELLEKFTKDAGYPVPNKKGTFEENPTHESETRMDAPDFDLTDETILKEESQLTIDVVLDQEKQLKAKKQKQKEDKIFKEKLKQHKEQEDAKESIDAKDNKS